MKYEPLTEEQYTSYKLLLKFGLRETLIIIYEAQIKDYDKIWNR